ncbi:MAG: hypothetical protein EOL88_14475, partial [Bacteroidia bacterium]|nr:hypothetical protein [Bacteroidia bacterium]
MKNLMFMMAVLICSAATAQQPAISLPITKTEIQEVVNSLTNKIPGSEVSRMERGVLQTAGLWQEENGTKQDFITFCTKNYISDPEEREIVFQKISGYMESLGGHFNKISLDLMTNLHLDNGPLHSIDALFGAYSPGAHLSDDFYANKIAFLITLNFPSYSLDEKNTRSKTWSRREWAYARLGDRFTTRVPAELIQASAAAETRSDIYISEYNIIMGNLRDNTNQ